MGVSEASGQRHKCHIAVVKILLNHLLTLVQLIELPDIFHRLVTQSSEMESIVQEDMEEGDTVISGRLLGRVIEEGHIEPQFKRYEQAIALDLNYRQVNAAYMHTRRICQTSLFLF